MFVGYEGFLANFDSLRAQIQAACVDAGRDPASVAILPITKNHPPVAAEFVRRAGLPAVGENRVQEARDKKQAANAPGLQWELVGHLQSNKARLAAGVFDRVQSVDSSKIAKHLDGAAREIGRALRVLVQVNAGRDPAKFGCEIDATPALIEMVLSCPGLRLEGLMSIAPLSEDLDVARRTFEALRELRDSLAAQFRVDLPELSMGMSGDWRAAILAGSTQVRIGTALFGARM